MKQILLITGLCLRVMLQAQIATVPSGSGTEDDPYQIATVDNLYWLSQTSSVWDNHFIQTADIDASVTSSWDSGTGFSPIGDIFNEFTGSYNGKGHTISELVINRSSSDYIGLFGHVFTGATIDSIGLPGISIIGDDNVGGLIGLNYGKVSECYTSGSISGGDESDYVGGLIGRNHGEVSICYVTGNVSNGNDCVGGLIGINVGIVNDCYATGSISGYSDIGGLIGYNSYYLPYVGIVSNCYATGSVSGNWAVGGLMGGNFYATVSDCHATGNVSENSLYGAVGGLLGKNYGTVSYSYAIGNVSGNCDVGGLIGKNEDGTASYCYATGSVSSSISSKDANVGGLVGSNGGKVGVCYTTGNVSGNNLVGGLIGSNHDTVSNCYVTGSVSGVNESYNIVGGLIGYNSKAGTVSDCYATGRVSAYSSYGALGGLTGNNYATVIDCFWDNQTTGMAAGYGYNDSTFIATGKTTGEMKTKNTFTDAGWDFDSIWAISSTINNGYPYFASLIPPSTSGINLIVKNELNIYPNPATDVFRISSIEGTVTLTISDISGRLLLTKVMISGEMILVSSLPNGIYMITVKSKSIKETGKLIIQR